MHSKKLLIVAVIVGAIIAFYSLGFDQYLSLDSFREQRDSLLSYQDSNPWQAALLFFALYVAVTALSLPQPP